MNEYMNGEELHTMINEKQDMVIDDLLPIGVVLFGAPEKTGKTFFALQISDAIVHNKPLLNFNVNKGEVLYIALEDLKGSFQYRLKKICFEPSKHMHFIFSSDGLSMNLTEEIAKINKHNNLKLVVIDTLAKISRAEVNNYQSEYDEMANFHKLAIENNLCILLITHIKKKIDYNHPFDNYYGTRGRTAGADGMMVLLQPSDDINEKQLCVKGKDIPFQRINVKHTEDMCLKISNEKVCEVELDEDLMKVISYVVSKKSFLGTHSELNANVKLNSTGNVLSRKIKSNIELLKRNFIHVEYPPRTSKERLIKLVYVGNDEISNDDMTINDT